MMITKKMAIFVFTVLIGFQINANASFTATFTADNHYAFYVGNSDGTSLSLLGNNELGYQGNPGDYNWSLPETYNFDLTDGKQIFIAAWGDYSGTQALLGQIVDNETNATYITNADNWLWMPTYIGLNDGSPAPDPATLTGFIQTQQWETIQTSIPNDNSTIWAAFNGGPIQGISTDADWIWGPKNADEGGFHIYTTHIAVPEPGTLMSLLLGMAGLASLSFRRKK